MNVKRLDAGTPEESVERLTAHRSVFRRTQCHSLTSTLSIEVSVLVATCVASRGECLKSMIRGSQIQGSHPVSRCPNLPDIAHQHVGLGRGGERRGRRRARAGPRWRAPGRRRGARDPPPGRRRMHMYKEKERSRRTGGAAGGQAAIGGKRGSAAESRSWPHTRLEAAELSLSLSLSLSLKNCANTFISSISKGDFRLPLASAFVRRCRCFPEVPMQPAFGDVPKTPNVHYNLRRLNARILI